MDVGIGCNSIFDKQGHYKKYDGIGNYTFNVLNELKKNPTLTLKSCYFNFVRDIFVKAENPDLWVYQNVFLPDVLPFYSFHDLEKKIKLFHSTDHLIPKLKRTPIVATIHDATLFKGISYKDSSLRNFKNSLLKKHAQYADHVITVSNATVPDLIEYWKIDPKKNFGHL